MKRIVIKLSLMASLVAIIAIVVPAMASATELQEKSKPGVPLPVGSTVNAESKNMTFSNTVLGTWSCSSALESFSLWKSPPGTVYLEGTAGSTSGCQKGWIEKFTLWNFRIVEPGVGKIALKFTWRFSTMECPFEGEGTFTYNAGTNVISLKGMEFKAPALCGTESGKPKVNADFALTSWSGDQVLIVDPPAKWTLQSPAASSGGWLQDVSCASAIECVAVGYNGTPTAQRWNGSEWVATSVPGTVGLSDVSCSSSTSCIALPTSGLGAVRWDGSKWSTITAVLPAEATSPKLLGISCTSPSYCIAVGRYTLPGAKSRTLAERFDGEKWTVLTTASEEGGENDLSAVSCTSSESCTAIGRKGGKPLALRWNGSTWSTLASPGKTPSGNNDISCSSPSACMVVGLGLGSTAERWNGSVWSNTATAQPKDAGSSYRQLYGVSCVSASECIAVGSYDRGGYLVPLAERWNGTEWSAQEAVDPKAEESELYGVSCSSANRCTAVGYSLPGNPLIERYQ